MMRKGVEQSLPRSLIFLTLEAGFLTVAFLVSLVSLGDIDKPATAESTLERLSVAMMIYLSAGRELEV